MDARKREHLAAQSNHDAGVHVQVRPGFYPLGATGGVHGLHFPTEDPKRPTHDFGSNELPGDGEADEVLERTRYSGTDLASSAMRFYECDCPGHQGAPRFGPFQVFCVPKSDFRERNSTALLAMRGRSMTVVLPQRGGGFVSGVSSVT